ncbi:hemolysin family protein [Floccifex sp.]|uniref:hemolysin family protein n=1 Tax=Floccifex sp. TaxID=2815810 RepID=UPI002A75F316|nr:hemolysin family protein [Floccifex sp.]MDD7281325.1 hemolysin family protein [Erysipelotrichaceae bacterium]MDY2958910.1 hemolysin family protein [Floccifex sp.]
MSPWILVLLFLLSFYFAMVYTLFEYDSKNEKTDSILTTISWYQLMLIIGMLMVSLILLKPYLNKLYFVLFLFIYGYVYFLIFEKLVKIWTLSRSDKFQLKMVQSFFKIYPFLSIFTFFLKIKVVKPQEISEEDIRELISASSESGNLEEPQKEYIENIFEFDDTNVDEICTHRSEVIALSLEDDIKEWHTIILNNRHTFYPVYQQDEDDIIGVLDTRDYFRLSKPSMDTILKKAVDKPFFVPENMKTDDLFRQMQQKKTYFAIVLDEYGGMNGIVTLHDIIETILGEMNEEDDSIEPEDIQKLAPNKFLIKGTADLEEVCEALNITLPVDEFETIGGYILDCYGKIPEDGTGFDIDLKQIHVHVKNMVRHHIDQMIVYKKEITDDI